MLIANIKLYKSLYSLILAINIIIYYILAYQAAVTSLVSLLLKTYNILIDEGASNIFLDIGAQTFESSLQWFICSYFQVSFEVI
jgi:ABC-type multidrug transport system permease subunit